MDRKERILAFILQDSYIPLRADELAVVLDVPKCDYDEFLSILDELTSEGKVYTTKKDKYMPSNISDVFSGVLSCNINRKFGFVRCESGDDIYISSENMYPAFNNDTVLVKVDERNVSGNRREGKIIRVLKRGNKNIVGIIYRARNNQYIVVPDNREFYGKIYISDDKLNGAVKDDRVLVSIDRYDNKNTPLGSVVMSLGHKNNIASCLDGLLAQNGLFADFSYNVKNELKSIPVSVNENEIKGREDLRNLTVITIDGDDSRDFDDAISLEISDNSNYLLGVHIADVSHYVKEGTELDKEALRRGTSVYFPHTVIPMLPEELSNGICSLNPDVDRLTLSVFMELDKEGNIHSNRITESVIHSDYRMTYNDVNKIFDGDKELTHKYKEIVPMLFAMNDLAKALSEKRKNRGAIDFDFPETYVVCDDDANPVDIALYERGNSHRLIESFMLIANETIAQTAFWSELPFVYRVHEAPSNEKLTEFNEFIKNFGYRIKGKTDSESIHPKALQDIAEKVKGTPEEFMISKMMLRSLMKACYRDSNDGHFGLAAKYYCHFTSPIRRYPDLIIHRILKEFLKGKLDNDRCSHYSKILSEVSAISTDREIEAEKVERDAVDMLKTEYMRQFIGCSFNAVITSVTSFGMFAMLKNSCEGLIRYETMNGDYYEYDDESHCVRGNRTNETYKIGDNVEITVVSADILTRRIDFVRKSDNRPNNISRILEKKKSHRKSNKPKLGNRRKRR